MQRPGTSPCGQHANSSGLRWGCPSNHRSGPVLQVRKLKLRTGEGKSRNRAWGPTLKAKFAANHITGSPEPRGGQSQVHATHEQQCLEDPMTAHGQVEEAEKLGQGGPETNTFYRQRCVSSDILQSLTASFPLHLGEDKLCWMKTNSGSL